MRSTKTVTTASSNSASTNNEYWQFFALPWIAIPEYLQTIGVTFPQTATFSSVSRYAGLASRAVTTGLVQDAITEQVVTPLFTLAQEYRQYDAMMRQRGPRWVKTHELPTVADMKKLERQYHALLEQEKKLKTTIAHQEINFNKTSLNLRTLFQRPTEDTETDNIKKNKLFHLHQIKEEMLIAKLSELTQLEQDIQETMAALNITKKQAAIDIKEANHFLLETATQLANSYSSETGKNSDHQFDLDWPAPITEQDYRAFKEKLGKTYSLNATQLASLDIDKLRFLVKSRFAILKTNDTLAHTGKKERIAVLVPVHKEFNRLKEVDECITGENFLEEKCEDLTWLLQGCNHIDGKLYFIDDQAPHGKPGEKITRDNQSHTRTAPNKEGEVTPCIRRTIDAIDELLDEGGRLKHYRNMCICLGYEELTTQIHAYQDSALRDMHPDDLANKSVKAGAVHLGLRYIADHQLADDIILTDADNSIHLGTIGTLIHERIHHHQPAIIGARRIPGSVVGNKSSDRHQLSFLFNMLNRLLLNVQVPDTQVGCKLIAANQVAAISPHMRNMTMAFDVELIRALQETGATPTSIPIYWADSPEESQSSAQANNMFKGVIDIFMKMYGYDQDTQQSTHSATKKTIALLSFDDAWKKLLEDREAQPALESVLQLASDPVFHFIIEHTQSIYDTLTPEMYRDFINSFTDYLIKLSQGEIDQACTRKLLNSLKTLYDNTTESHAVGFALEKFPGIFSVLELLYRDPSYARVLAPLFLGDTALGKKIAGVRQENQSATPKPIAMEAFSTYCKNEQATSSSKETPMTTLFSRWCLEARAQEKKSQQPSSASTARKIAISEKREQAGWNHLKNTLEKKASNRTPKKIISLVMQFDQSGALDTEGKISARQYQNWQLFIKGKADALRDSLKKAGLSEKDIVINLLIVDARGEDARKKDPHHLTEKAITAIIHESNEKNGTESVLCEYYNLSTQCPSALGSKATAVRQGMRHALSTMDDASKPDAVGFIDFSPKIRIEEMGALIAQVVGNEESPHAAIGTRRATEAEVVGKRKEFLFRSMVCNHVVKAFLPELAHLSDTQTGFKLFPSQPLQAILQEDDKSADLNIQSFAFDVQLLMRLIAKGCAVDELPVVFNDNTQDLLDPDLAGPAGQMFQDFLIISAEEQRRKRKECHGKTPSFSEPVFMGNGAEHVVYDCGNDMLLKIEAQHVNPNFRLILQHLLFNKSRGAADATTSGDDLFIMQFNKLLQLGVLEQWIPLLRNIPDLNRLVLGAISAWEDKTKSIDLEEVRRRGKGLVGGFAYIEQPFSVTLDGVCYNFDPTHRSKICKRAQSILQDTFIHELSNLLALQINSNHTAKNNLATQTVINETISSIREKVIDPAIRLFDKMWRRGLFDLDTNIISDLGFFLDNNGQSVLQSLDPGEMITGIMQVDVERAKSVLEKRSDILLMNAQIARIVNQLNLNPEETQKIIQQLRKDIIGYYTDQMTLFFDRIASEKSAVKSMLEADPTLSEEEASQKAGIDMTYGADWRGTQNKMQFMMDDIAYQVDPQKADAQSYHADQESRLLSAGYNLPYRAEENLPIPAINSTEQIPSIHSTVVLIVPEGKEDAIEGKLSPETQGDIFVHGIEKGSIVPLFDFSEHYKTATEKTNNSRSSTQSNGSSDTQHGNTLFVLDAGGGTRTAGIGQQAGSKGSIKLAGKCLNEHAINAGQLIADRLSKKGINDCIILASCDDFFSCDKAHMAAFVDNMASYFQTGNDQTPGLYWSDLPDGGKHYMPLTAKDTYAFLTSNKIKEEVKHFLLNILITRGYAEQGIVDNIYGCVNEIYDALLDFLNPELTTKKHEQSSSESLSLLGGISALGGIMSEITERYAKLIQWHAMQSKDEISGLKRPFLMVMKKTFFDDLHNIINNHHQSLDNVKEEITWENFLLRGLKADQTMWSLFKPKNIESTEWNAIYAELQALKNAHGIDPHNHEQNEQRAYAPIWHNLDDPYAMFMAAKEMFGASPMHQTTVDRLTFTNDLPGNCHQIVFSNPNQYRLEIVGLNTTLTGVKIEPTYLQDRLVSHQYQENIFLYDLTLKPGDHFKPTIGHVHIQHNGSIYSSPIGPFTKDALKNQPVYIYERDHQQCFVAKPLLHHLDGKLTPITMGTFADYLKAIKIPTMTNTPLKQVSLFTQLSNDKTTSTHQPIDTFSTSPHNKPPTHG